MKERTREREKERERERENFFFHHDYNRFDLQLSARKDGVSI